MRYLFFIFFLFSFAFVSCKHHEVTNEYRDAKTHPSEQIGKEHKKAAKKAQHDFLKNQKTNKKSMEKKNAKFFKKKKRH